MSALSREITALIESLDALASDSEVMHSEADKLVIGWMESSQTTALRDIAAAYRRVQDRASWWATA
jgi:hypothetical protein